MRKMLACLAAAFGLLMAGAHPAAAITGDFVEDREHPFVGLVTFYDSTGAYSHRCSGSLLTPTIFLTAGHCTEGATTARVYFQQDAGANLDPATGVDPVTGYPTSCAPGTQGVLCATSDTLHNYGYDGFGGFPKNADLQDAGLVILDQPIELTEYGSLAQAGSLDELSVRRGHQALTFTASGYGLSESSPVAVTSLRERLMATSQLTNLRSAITDGFTLQTNGNGLARGGTCSGDSGGPVFYGGTTSNTIVAVTSFGMNAYCRGVDFSYRTDTAAVLAWIESVVGASEFDQIDLVTI